MSAEFGEREGSVTPQNGELAYNPTRTAVLVAAGTFLGVGLGVALHTLAGLDSSSLLYWPTLGGCVGVGGVGGAVCGIGAEAMIASLTTPST